MLHSVNALRGCSKTRSISVVSPRRKPVLSDMSIFYRRLIQAVVLPLLLAALPVFAEAQISIDANPGSAERTRTELEELLVQYENVLQSPAYSDAVKNATRSRVDRIRERLTRGDFELGDRIVLSVRDEPDLPDTVTVTAGPKISLPLFGDIGLEGVLRSEVESRITEALSVFINDPVVTAQALMRVSVQGAVGQPGFYVVPAEVLLSETLMVAGGPAQNSKLEDLRIERGSTVVMRGDEVQEALRRGLTLDQLNLQAGDQVVLPADQSGSFLGNVGMIAGLVGSLSFILIRFLR